MWGIRQRDNTSTHNYSTYIWRQKVKMEPRSVYDICQANDRPEVNTRHE